MKKPADFNTYKSLRRMSFNDFNRWIRVFYESAYNDGVEDAMKRESLIVTDALEVAIEDDDLFDLLMSIKGIGEKKATEIMSKMKEFGVDESLFEEVEE